MVNVWLGCLLDPVVPDIECDLLHRPLPILGGSFIKFNQIAKLCQRKNDFIQLIAEATTNFWVFDFVEVVGHGDPVDALLLPRLEVLVIDLEL